MIIITTNVNLTKVETFIYNSEEIGNIHLSMCKLLVIDLYIDKFSLTINPKLGG